MMPLLLPSFPVREEVRLSIEPSAVTRLFRQLNARVQALVKALGMPAIRRHFVEPPSSDAPAQKNDDHEEEEEDAAWHTFAPTAMQRKEPIEKQKKTYGRRYRASVDRMASASFIVTSLPREETPDGVRKKNQGRARRPFNQEEALRVRLPTTEEAFGLRSATAIQQHMMQLNATLTRLIKTVSVNHLLVVALSGKQAGCPRRYCAPSGHFRLPLPTLIELAAFQYGRHLAQHVDDELDEVIDQAYPTLPFSTLPYFTFLA